MTMHIMMILKDFKMYKMFILKELTPATFYSSQELIIIIIGKQGQ